MTPTAQAAELLRGPNPRAAGLTLCGRNKPREKRPEFASEFVPRPALVRRLREARNAALALIVAPPGYGKTSLLSNWAQRDERPFIWLAPDWSKRPYHDVASLYDQVWPADRATGGCVVVLDDAHLIAPDHLRDLVDAVLRTLPSDSILVLATRTEPHLPVGRMRAHRAIVELRMKDLAMTPDEATDLLRLAGFQFEGEAIEALVARTEGWAAAIYLAALSQRDHPGTPQGIAGFRGDDHLLSEYLRDDVLLALPVELRRFVLRTAVLDDMSASSCDRLLDDRASATALANVARATQLLRPLNQVHDCYCWHPLVRETLAAELRRLEPGLETQLQRRASKWYGDRGDTERAIDHACRAQDADRVGELLAESIVPVLTRGRSQQVRAWLSAFTHERIGDCPPLAMCAGLTCLAAGDIGQAEQWALSANASASAGRGPTRGPARAVSAGLLVIAAVVARTGLCGMRQAVEQAYELVPEASPWRPVCLYLRGVSTHLTGDPGRASTLLESAIELGGETLPSLTAVSLAQRAMIAMESREWDLVGELTDRAAQIIGNAGLEREPSMALVFAARAASLAHEGRVDEAKQDLRRGIARLTELGNDVSWRGAEVSLLLAHASLWLADIVGARSLLAQASRFARKTVDGVVFESWFAEAWSYLDTLAETSLAGPSALTVAELRVLRYLPSHRSFREIADQLGVSTNTVKTQAHAVYRKLGAASRSEAIVRAEKAGLLGH